MIQDIAPRQFRLQYHLGTPDEEDPVFVFRGQTKREDRALARRLEDGSLRVPTYRELKASGAVREDSPLQYLFAIDDTRYYLLRNGGAEDITVDGYEYVPVRTFCDSSVGSIALAGTTAYHLFFWYRDNTFCGRCGGRMEPYDIERAVRCPSCGNLVYPKLMPAVIIAVKNGEKLLVSRYAGRAYGGIALLAGFCEIGESMEQTVAREVMEEVGLKVKNITYYASQPWGIDSDLLAGFSCDVDGSPEIHRDDRELAYADWIDRTEIEPQRNLTSLTRTMIEAFRTGRIH